MGWDVLQSDGLGWDAVGWDQLCAPSTTSPLSADTGILRRILHVMYTDCVRQCSGPMYVVSDGTGGEGTLLATSSGEGLCPFTPLVFLHRTEWCSWLWETSSTGPCKCRTRSRRDPHTASSVPRPPHACCCSHPAPLGPMWAEDSQLVTAVSQAWHEPPVLLQCPEEQNQRAGSRAWRGESPGSADPAASSAPPMGSLSAPMTLLPTCWPSASATCSSTSPSTSS